MQSLPSYQLLILPHPESSTLFYKLFFKLHDARNIAISHEPRLEDDLSATTIIVAVSSIAALPALLVDKDVILLYSSRIYLQMDWPFYENYKMVLTAYDDASLSQQIVMLEKNDRLREELAAGRKRLREDYFPDWDETKVMGEPSRVNQIIKQLMKKSGRSIPALNGSLPG